MQTRGRAEVTAISANLVKFLQELRHLGFTALLSVPHLLSREIMMNRRHYHSPFS